MRSFEELLTPCQSAIERYVKFKVPAVSDAQDILQNVYLTGYQKLSQLKSEESFKAWMFTIARNEINAWYRQKAQKHEIPWDGLFEKRLTWGRSGKTQAYAVREVLQALSAKDKQMLTLYYLMDMPQDQIAQTLHIPLGTVKSRLHTARENFKKRYPTPASKGDTTMSNLPKILPKYTIEKQSAAPFSVRCEELSGWLIVPKLGQKLSWGLYEAPSGQRTEHTDMAVVGRAQVHGVEGVEIVATQYNSEDYYRTGSVNEMERRFVAQLTDTHCRFLAESHEENGVRKLFTFLDGDSFLENWGFGPDNCGTEVALSPKGVLKRAGSVITGASAAQTQDIVGRYLVTIGGKTYDTVCLMDVECFNDAVASECYLDKHGRTILWRRFNRDDWALSRFGMRWSEKLPENQRLIINGQTYVHWYDCVTSYIC